jgi:thiamine pyrophosphokinase
MKAAILSNGDLADAEKLKQMLPKFDLVICCDGGIRHLKDLNLSPDIIVGDFDSVDSSLLQTYIDQGIPTLRFPKDKDKTDTQIAVETALQKGADSIVLLGALGSRWDHSYANVMLLVKLAQMGIDGMILHSHNRILVSNKVFRLTGNLGQFVSLLPLGENVKIQSTRGLHYPVTDQEMPLEQPYGISNYFTEEEAEVRIASGWLMAVIADD